MTDIEGLNVYIHCSFDARINIHLIEISEQVTALLWGWA